MVIQLLILQLSKNNRNVYRKELDNYRTYILDKIVNVYEIRFEQDVLERLFGTKTTIIR